MKLLGVTFVAIQFLSNSESIQLDIFTVIECNVSLKKLVTSLQKLPRVVLFRFSFVYWNDWRLLARPVIPNQCGIRSKETHICKPLLLEAGTINFTVTLSKLKSRNGSNLLLWRVLIYSLSLWVSLMFSPSGKHSTMIHFKNLPIKRDWNVTLQRCDQGSK